MTKRLSALRQTKLRAVNGDHRSQGDNVRLADRFALYSRDKIALLFSTIHNYNVFKYKAVIDLGL